jgi:hypothetical protein
MAAVLSSVQLKTGLLEARASKALRLIAYLQIRNNWAPVPIAKSKGAGLLQWSESTWTRAVKAAEQLGWLRRDVRSGRVKGNRRGYNPGSLYAVVWDNLPAVEKPSYKDRPAIRVAARLYRNRIQQPGHRGGQPGQNGHLSNSEAGHGAPEAGHIPVFTTASNLDPVLSKERDLTPEVEGRGQLGAPSALSVDLMPPAATGHFSPPPTPQGGPSAGEGVPCPPDIAAQAKSAPWYKGRSA